MCGFVGWVRRGDRVARARLYSALQRINHRGPDDEGIFIRDNVGLGHKRLAIIDLTPLAHQPMCDDTQTLWIVYNGEVYNFRELRQVLENRGYKFRSHSDAEVVLLSYKEWGDAAFLKFNGMFALAIYSIPEQEIIIVRDRYGIKPVYYYYDGDNFIFASEIKSIIQLLPTTPQVDLYGLREYFTFQNIYTDRTLIHNVRVLLPGHILKFDTNRHLIKEIRKYWDFNFKERLTVDDISEKDAISKLRTLFEQAVIRQTVSDVEIGAFLSGGMDSGSIVAVLSRHLPGIKTFTIGFDTRSADGLEQHFDERPVAEILASYLKTDHFERFIHPGIAKDIIPEVIYYLEDLRLGMSYPNYLAMQFVSHFVKVVISGAGGDELFGGYPWRYYTILNVQNEDEFYRNWYRYWQRLIPENQQQVAFNPKIWKYIESYSPYEPFVSILRNGHYKPNDWFSMASYFELKTFLHGLFIIEDHTSMAHSLEVRVPFLDNDLVEFAIRLPMEYKINPKDPGIVISENISGKKEIYYRLSNSGKVILRKAMKGLIPDEILERKKQGFSSPEASWYRGPIVDTVKRWLLSPNSRILEFFNRKYISRILNEHIEGIANHRLLLWSFISFEHWLRHFITE